MKKHAFIALLLLTLVLLFNISSTFAADLAPSRGSESAYTLTEVSSAGADTISYRYFDSTNNTYVTKYYKIALNNSSFGDSLTWSEDSTGSTGSVKITLPNGTEKTYYYTYITPSGYTETSTRVTSPSSSNVTNVVFKNIEYTTSGQGGAAIYNTVDNSTLDVVADFVGNYSYYTSSGGSMYGGAVYNSGQLNSISGKFLNNGISTKGDYTATYGGAIYNKGTITTVNADFVGNYSKGIVDNYWPYIYGGAVYNEGTITNLTGKFVGNYVYDTVNTSNTSYMARGGALYNTKTISSLSSDFVGNYAFSTYYSYGGAIYNTGTISSLTGDFISNYVSSKYTASYGGAIYNTSSNGIGLTNNKFIGNYAISTSGKALGGAIYTTKNLTINADNGTTLFSGNYTQVGSAEKDYNAIYVGSSSGTLTLNSTNNGVITFEDNINGENGYTLNITGDSTSVVNMYNTISNAKLNVSGVGKVDFADGVAREFNFILMTSDENVKYSIDVDLANSTSDTFIISNSSSGTITLDNLNILSGNWSDFIDSDGVIQVVKASSDGLQLAITDALKTELGKYSTTVEKDGKYVVSSTVSSLKVLYKYDNATLKRTVGVGTTTTTNDSLQVFYELISGSRTQLDTLAELVQLETTEERNFNVVSDYTVISDLGTATAGTININGNNYSIDLDSKNGIQLTNETTLNLNNVTIKNGSIVNVINDNATVNVANSTLNSDITGGKGDLNVVNSTLSNVNVSNLTIESGTNSIVGAITATTLKVLAGNNTFGGNISATTKIENGTNNFNGEIKNGTLNIADGDNTFTNTVSSNTEISGGTNNFGGNIVSDTLNISKGNNTFTGNVSASTTVNDGNNDFQGEISTGTLSVANGNNTFSGTISSNTDVTGGSNNFTGDINSNTLNVSNGKNIFSGNISSTTNISNGTNNISGTFTNSNVTVSGGTLSFNENTFADSNNSLKVTGGNINLVDGVTTNYVINSLISSEDVNYSIDIAFNGSTGVADKILASSNSTGVITINSIKFNGNLTQNTTINILDTTSDSINIKLADTFSGNNSYYYSGNKYTYNLSTNGKDLIFNYISSEYAKEANGLISNISRVSESILKNNSSVYTLTEVTSDTTVPDNAVTVKIDGKTYYYVPNTTAELTQKDYQHLASTGNVALKELTSSDGAIYKIGDKYYGYDANKLPESAYALIPTTTSGNGVITKYEFDKTTNTLTPKYYELNLKDTEYGTGGKSQTITINVLGKEVPITVKYDDSTTKTYTNIYDSAITNTEGNTITIEDAIFENITSSAPLVYNNKGSITNLTSDFISNIVDFKENYLSGGGLIGNYASSYSTSTSTSTIGDITGGFISNTVSINKYDIYGGGLIGNYASSSFSSSSSSIDDITGDFISNTVTVNPDVNTYVYGGGLIGNYASSYSTSTSPSTIGDITGNFISNTVTVCPVKGGGLIGNYAYSYSSSSSIGDITGDFISNTVTANGSVNGGGLIGNYASSSSSSSIGDITGDFISNTVTARVVYGGGLIGIYAYESSSSSIGDITGDFISNTVSINKYVIYGGGLIGNYAYESSSSSIGDINSNFSNNTVKLTDTSSQTVMGGVIGNYANNNSAKATIKSISGTFENNSVIKESGSATVYAGVIYNSDIITNGIINSTFKNNYVKLAEGTAYASVIYTTKDLSINADNGTTLFSGNYSQIGDGEKNYNAVYVDSDSAMLTLKATNNGVITFDNNNITGVSGYTLNITGDSTGTINLHNEITNTNLNITDVGKVDFVDNTARTYNLVSMNSAENVKYSIDIDLTNGVSDKFTVSGSATGTILLDSVNLIGTQTDVSKVYQILNLAEGSTLQLALSEDLQTTDSLARLTNTVKSTDDFSQKAGFVLLTTNTINDSIKYCAAKAYDTLVLINQKETTETRNFNFDDASTYTLSDNLGTTATGTLNINGVKTDDGYSTIDLNNRAGFSIGANTTLNLNNVTITNAYKNGDGGAIYNDGGTLGDITGSFTNNRIVTGDGVGTVRGGAIYNNGTIGDITADFTGNVADYYNYSSDDQYVRNGGAIYNTENGVIGDINAKFVSNRAKYGGAIYNMGQIGDITGLFQNNIVGPNSYAAAGAIYNGTGASVGNINADFINNSNNTPSAASPGGAITNYGTMKNIKGNFTGNYTRYFHGGAIYNEGTIGDIEGDFTGNYSGGWKGGAIANYDDKAVINSITGNFIGNHSRDDGGAIENKGKIGDITGYFEGNHASNDGGAISNQAGSMGAIKADFKYNYSKGTSSSDRACGGAIYNAAIITSIDGDFTGNYVENSAKNSYATGGAILNSGKIDSITGDFTDNYASVSDTNSYAQAGAMYLSGTNTINNINSNFTNNFASSTGNYAQGGAIYMYSSTVTSLIGNFKNNYAISTSGNAEGGAIYMSGGKFSDLKGDFIGNYVKSESGNAYGGAISKNLGSATFESSFKNNYAISETGTALGGAIYTKNAYTTFLADGKANEFTGNYTQVNGVKDDNAIYVDYNPYNPAGGNYTNVSAITFDMRNGGSYIMNDNIKGDDGYTINLVGDGTNTVFDLNNTISGKFNLSMNNTTLDINNNVIDSFTLGSFTSSGTSKIKIDLDYTNGLVDNFVADTSSTGTLIIDSINTFGTQTEKSKVYQILSLPKGSTLELVLGDNINKIKDMTIVVADTVKSTDVYTRPEGFDLATTTTKNDSLIYYLDTKIDLLATLNKKVTPNERNFNFVDNSIYTIFDDLGTTAVGTFNINGVRTSGINSKIDLDGRQGFYLEANTTLNLDNVDVVNGSSSTNGGAIYNNGGTLTKINGNFSNNTANASGGAIYNNGTIGAITGNFTDNSAKCGGAIYINESKTIGDISGNFENNSVSDSGGAIFMHNRAVVNSITGDFINNHTGGSAGALDIGGSKVSSISGDFTGNYVSAESSSVGGAVELLIVTIDVMNSDFENNYILVERGSASGGAIYANTGYINTFNANFKNNYAISNSGDAGGGAIFTEYSNDGFAKTFIGDFKNNYAISTSGDAAGGAIYIEESSFQNLQADFTGNYVKSDSGDVKGGAVYNFQYDYNDGTTKTSVFDSSFKNNYAISETGTALGGAIYTSGLGITFLADGKTNEFTGNYTQVNGVKDDNAIYVGSYAYSSTNVNISYITFSMKNGGSYIMNDNIAGDDGYTINLVGDGTNTVFDLNNTISGKFNLSMNNTTLDINNNVIDSFTLGKFTSSGTSKIKIDLDGTNGLIDNFIADTSSTGTLIIDSINAFGNQTENEKIYQVLNLPTGSSLQLVLGDNVNEDVDMTQVIGDTVKNTDIYARYNFFDLATTKTKNDSIVYYLTKNIDVLATLNQKVTPNERNFNFVNDDVYTLSEDLKTTANGVLNINGIITNGNYSVIDLDNRGGFYLTSGTTLKLTNVTLQNGNSSDSLRQGRGGAVYNNGGTITSISGSFVGNYAPAHGGAINNKGTIGDITANFDGDYASGNGGAVYNEGKIGDITGDFENNYSSVAGAIGNYSTTAVMGNISGNFTGNYTTGGPAGAILNKGTIGDIEGEFSSNRAGYAGGAIFNENAKIGNITASFSGNYGSSGGGAIYNVSNSSPSTIKDITGDFTGNYANYGYGGAIYNYGNNASIGNINGSFTGNYTNYGNGGAIYNTGNYASIGNIKGLFKNNYTSNSGSGYGGAICNEGGTIKNIEADFINNHASDSSSTSSYGGAIYNTGNYASIGDITGDFTGNYAGYCGGAIFNAGGSKIGNIKGDFTNNKVNYENGKGGAIYNYGSIEDIEGSFSGNYTGSEGGAIYNYGGSIGNIIGDFTNNYVKQPGSSDYSYGGAIYVYGGNIKYIEGNFSGNYSGYCGGAIYASGSSTNTIGNIKGDFTNNYSWSKTSSYGGGGAIYNQGITIGDIEGSFIGNYTSSMGGAICNYGTIGNITGDFKYNYVYNETTAIAMGGALYGGNFGNITGDFIGNYTYTEQGSPSFGGAIYNGSYGDLVGNFTGNYSVGASNTYGGAISYANIKSITGDFTNNYISSVGIEFMVVQFILVVVVQLDLSTVVSLVTTQYLIQNMYQVVQYILIAHQQLITLLVILRTTMLFQTQLN